MKLPHRIRCGSRSIKVGKPNWLTGLASFGIDDIGTNVMFTMDAAATRKVIAALGEVLQRQEQIEAERKVDRAGDVVPPRESPSKPPAEPEPETPRLPVLSAWLMTFRTIADYLEDPTEENIKTARETAELAASMVPA